MSLTYPFKQSLGNLIGNFMIASNSDEELVLDVRTQDGQQVSTQVGDGGVMVSKEKGIEEGQLGYMEEKTTNYLHISCIAFSLLMKSDCTFRTLHKELSHGNMFLQHREFPCIRLVTGAKA